MMGSDTSNEAVPRRPPAIRGPLPQSNSRYVLSRSGSYSIPPVFRDIAIDWTHFLRPVIFGAFVHLVAVQTMPVGAAARRQGTMPRAPHLKPPEDSGAAERLRQFEQSRGIEPDPGIPPFPQDE